MKRIITIAGAVVVFGWMALAGTFFLAENPGALGPVADLVCSRLDLSPERLTVHNPGRVIDHLRTSLARGTFERFQVEVAGALVFSLWLLVVFTGTGLWMLRAVGLRRLRAVEAFAVSASLGMGGWGLFVLALGVLRLLYPAVLAGALVAATLVSWPRLREWLEELRAGPPRKPRGAIEWTAIILAGLALALGLLYTLTPAIQSDGLRYHLSAPQVYLREHRIVYLPFNAFTNFPFLIEMLFTLALGIAGDLAAKMVHFECLALCGLFLALLSAKLLEGTGHGKAMSDEGRVGNGAGLPPPLSRPGVRSPLLAPLVFLTTPTALLTAAWGFVDLGTTLFFVAMVYALVNWQRETGSEGQEARGGRREVGGGNGKWRLVAGLFLGFLMGTKYTALVVLAFVPIVILIELPFFVPAGRWDFKYLLRSSLLVGLVAAAAASPWFVKNAVFTGNPVYPLAWKVFGGGEWSTEQARFYYAKSAEKGFPPRKDKSLGEIVRHLLITPWAASIHWCNYEAQFLGPVFLLWIPLLLRVLMDIKHRTARACPFRLVVYFAAAYCGLWYVSYQSNRLLIPALALLAVLVAHSLAVARRTARWLAGGAVAVLLVLSLYNIEWSAEWIFRETTTKPSAFSYLAGLQSRDSYIRRAFPPYAVFQVMRELVTDDEAVLFVGEYRAFHCPVRWRANDWFDTPLILHYIRTTPDNDALLDRLLAEGVGWIFLNPIELMRVEAIYRRILSRPLFTKDEKRRYNDLFPVSFRGRKGSDEAHPRLRNRFSSSGMFLYQILPRSGKTPTVAEGLAKEVAWASCP